MEKNRENMENRIKGNYGRLVKIIFIVQQQIFTQIPKYLRFENILKYF